MDEPEIIYGTLAHPIHRNAQYLLMEAGIGNGVYDQAEFVRLINTVSLVGLRDEGRHDVELQRGFLETFSKMGKTVEVKNFNPDRDDLLNFVNTTFEEMHAKLNRVRR